MSGRLPDEVIRTVRERASLTEVVGDVVALKRRARSVTGLCPFHAEKTPSFSVSEDRGFYHCFGCGEHGDVFAFVMKTTAASFPEAVRRVAERFGVPLPESTAAAGPAREPLAAANEIAARFYRETLQGASGARARAYLVERGVSDAMVERFGIGYAPAGGEALARRLRTARVRTEDALAAGLVIRRDGPAGGLYDRFRERLVFPITDASGRRIVAFGGRLMPGRPAGDDAPPKYLNSPESPLFRKGQTLYGLALARDAVRRRARVLVVEGYLDVIALAQAGIAEVVAPLGTAVTVEQLRGLGRLADTVIACFDGDDAGRRAAARSFPLFVEAGLWGRAVFLPTGDDPDTFVRQHGPDALEALVTSAPPVVDAFLDQLAGPRRDAVGRRAEAAREVARVLQRVRSPFEFGVLAGLAAQRLGVREEDLRAAGAREPPTTVAPAPRATPPVPRDAVRFRRADIGAEEMLVELMAADADVVARVQAENLIAEFEHPTLRRAAEALAARGPEAHRDALVEELPEALRERVVRRLLGEIEDENRDQAIADCIGAIRARAERRRRRRLQEDLRAAEARGDTAAVADLLRRLQGPDDAASEKI